MPAQPSTNRNAFARTSSTRAPARRSPTPRDALQLLRNDHRKVADLFDQFEKARTDDRKALLAAQICAELKVHAQIEEEIFYPAAREALRNDDLLDEATVEHQSAKALIAEIEGASPGDELFDARVMVLGEYIKHHVKEEHNELFPQLRKARIDLKALGQALAERKEALQAEA